MIGGLLNNISPVVKNLLIINVLFYVATFLLQGQGLYLEKTLSSFLPGSGSFEPYQIVTHMFMHGGFTHILFNMFALVMFGSHLERVWGPKRFLIYYLACGIGAWAIYCGWNYYLIAQDLKLINQDLGFILDIKPYTTDIDFNNYRNFIVSSANEIASTYQVDAYVVAKVLKDLATPMLGASGAIYGVLLAFGMLFPNTRLMLIFPPIPIKAKFLVLFLGIFALYNGVTGTSDGVAHFAHLGGMIVGFILIKIWQKDRHNFY